MGGRIERGTVDKTLAFAYYQNGGMTVGILFFRVENDAKALLMIPLIVAQAS